MRECITSGFGEISNKGRILGPIATEASKYYEITNWVGIVVTDHPDIALNNKASISPNPNKIRMRSHLSITATSTKMSSQLSSPGKVTFRSYYISIRKLLKL